MNLVYLREYSEQLTRDVIDALSFFMPDTLTRSNSQFPDLEIGRYLGTLPNCRQSYHASGSYHWNARVHSRKPRWQSAADIWDHPPKSFATYRDSGNYSKTQIYHALRQHAYLPRQFPPSVAAALFNYLLPTNSSVLDPCAGWGDRLVAALASPFVSRYIGYDANEATQSGYKKQIKDFGKDGGFYDIQHEAFEDVKIDPNCYDLVFTSPPYYLAEIYSADTKQSHYRYSDFQSWLDGFFLPLITSSYASLKEDGILALNITNGPFREDGSGCDLVTPALKHAAHLGMRLKGHFDFQINKVTGKYEPIIIWRK